jgi:hypothetical protein
VPSPDQAIGDGTELLVVDGLLFDAVTTDVYHELLDALLEAASRRRVAVVSDDPAVERWALTVPGGTIWTHADAHHLRGAAAPPPIAAWDARFEADTGARRLGVEPAGELLVCSNHPGAVTRLTCSVCARPYCDVCLLVTERDGRVMCVACALNRAGVRKRRKK